MVVDFKKIDPYDTPILILKNLDGTAIQTLGYAFNIKPEIYYNEISSLSFDIPAVADGLPVPHYNDIVGTRIVDMDGWGQFILVDPSIKNDGKREIKSCKAFSLEYELTYKQMSLEENTYNFYNPVTPDSTILGIILSYLPSWKIGEVDESLIGKYRTFDAKNVNIYNFIKSTLQKTYGCIFDFDTYNREINVRAVSSVLKSLPVFLSHDNLVKDITVKENTENIFTVLDANGADGVTIRSVNPTGTNKIYNLDYYMNTTNFSQSFINAWDAWKKLYSDSQLPYYNLTVEKSLIISALLTAEQTLKDMIDVQLATLENEQAVYIEYLASLSEASSSEEIEEYTKKLSQVKKKIDSKNKQIISQKQLISTLTDEKNRITERLTEINNSLAFSEFFSPAELLVLDRYFKETSISESSFVACTAKSYINEDICLSPKTSKLECVNSDIVSTTDDAENTVFSLNNGSCHISELGLDAKIISSCIELKKDGSFIMSAYLSQGEISSKSFEKGCLSLFGKHSNCLVGMTSDNKITSVNFDMSDIQAYFTENTTEYEQRSVEWELYHYATDCLNSLCHPSYSFEVTSANFLAADEFKAFTNKLQLGCKLYLKIEDDTVLQPVFVGVSFSFENPASVTLKFSDTFSAADPSFSLATLLEQSISMGKTVDTNRFNYNSFIDSGAQTAVKSFMTNALDASKNAILSGNNMAVSWGAGGIRCRKYTDKTQSSYEDKQIAIINNSIVFTDDGWETAKMALGKFTDSSCGDSWGLVAPNIVGTLLAGNNLVIESETKDGDGVSIFKVDGSGATLHNANFDVVSEGRKRHILLDPTNGIAIGKYPLINPDTGSLDEENAKFWADSEGNVHFAGSLHGANGTFSGTLKAAEGEFTGKVSAKEGDIGGITINEDGISADGTSADGKSASFSINKDGTVTAVNGKFTGEITATSGTFTGTIKANDGYIGSKESGFEIDSKAIYNKKKSFTDTLSDGIYIGTDGIALGKSAFSVDEYGKLTASNAVIGGRFDAVFQNTLSSDGEGNENNGVYMHYRDGQGGKQLLGGIWYATVYDEISKEFSDYLYLNTKNGAKLKIYSVGNSSYQAPNLYLQTNNYIGGTTLYDEFNTSIACTGSDEGKPCIDLFAYKGSYRTPTNGARILINGGVENDSSITIAADKIGFFGSAGTTKQTITYIPWSQDPASIYVANTLEQLLIALTAHGLISMTPM